MTNLAGFLSIRKKASSAAEQKFLLVMATRVKALVLINLTNLSKHETQHMVAYKAYLITTFSEAPCYLAKYAI